MGGSTPAAWLEHSPSGHALPGSRSSSVSPDRRSAAGLHVKLSAGWDPLHPQPHRWGCNPEKSDIPGLAGKGQGTAANQPPPSSSCALLLTCPCLDLLEGCVPPALPHGPMDPQCVRCLPDMGGGPYIAPKNQTHPAPELLSSPQREDRWENRSSSKANAVQHQV